MLKRLFAVSTLLLLVSCAFLGLNQPRTVGQSLVQAYGTATAATALVAPLLAPPALIKADRATQVRDSSRVVHQTIETYWDTAGLSSCKQADPGNAGAVAACQGPNAQQILVTVSAELAVLTTFLTTYQGVKR